MTEDEAREEAAQFFKEVAVTLDPSFTSEEVAAAGMGHLKLLSSQLTTAERRYAIARQKRLERDKWIDENIATRKGVAINDFLNGKFPSLDYDDRIFLFQEIKSQIDLGVQYNGDYGVDGILLLGDKGLAERFRSEKRKRRFWSRIRLIWPITRSLAYLLIAGGSFGAAKDRFETTVISYLILIAASVWQALRIMQFQFLLSGNHRERQFNAILMRFGKVLTTPERTDVENSMKSIERLGGPAMVDAGCYSILQLMALWHLLTL